MSDLIITEDDCGTQNGILIDAKDPDALDRYLARNIGNFPRNTLITPLIQTRLGKYGKILVRSPMTCEAGDGVCQKCQGLNEHGSLHELGTNIGIRAAQAMAEPLTQFALDAKHGVRTAQSDRVQINGISGFRQIIESPKQFMNKATLASVSGIIDKIEKAPQGGYYIFVGGHSHYVTPNLEVIVNRGDKVDAGDALSEGIPKPDEVVQFKGLGAGRQYVVDALKTLYKNQGKDLDQRHFELLAKGELNNVKILNDSSNNFLKGDVISYNILRSSLGQNVKSIPLKDALGETLGKEYFHFSVGTRITPAITKYLQDENIKEVIVAPRAPEIEFVMKPATRAPLLNPDWMARLAHRNLKNTIQQAAHFGDSSNIHGTHPVPAYIFGLEFGQGEKGRY
jgi:DNA-directed RNA polymerase subunit beta'